MADKLKLVDQYAINLLEPDPNAYSEEWNADYERGFLDAVNKALELPTIEAEPVNTDKCKALRNIEGIRLILSNVYNTGSTLQDCDYDAIYKRIDVIENILKGK